ncbi:MAG: KH domain-containing protein [Actinomycetota bacterium]
MTSPREFGSVVAVVADHVPADTDVTSLEVAGAKGHWRLTLRMSTPGRVIGRHGTTADALRYALADHLGDPGLRLTIEEAPPPGDGPAPAPAGDREPRGPRPEAPGSTPWAGG